MQGLFTDWAEAWTAELGVDFELVKPTLVQTIFNDYVPHFVKRHQGVSESAVINLLSRARTEGWDTLELQDALQGRYSQWSTLRAEMIARTETLRLENRASVAAFQQGGVTEGEWFATPDDRLCPFCRKLHQQKFPLGEPLFKKGESMQAAGGLLKMNYEDVRHPPLHVFCRCVVLPVITVAELGGEIVEVVPLDYEFDPEVVY
jgi:SPP1 gp7 family putative phage head morphogenesis protein